MKSKKTFLAAISLMALSSIWAKGIYFVSGGDFRHSDIKYVIRTTEPNQQANVTPYLVALLSEWSNPDYTGKWSIKCGDTEHVFGERESIRRGTGATGEVNGNCTNAVPFTNMFAKAGNHIVKVFDDKYNIYSLYFRDMDDLISLYVDFSKRPTDTSSYSITLMVCPNLTHAYVAFNKRVTKLSNMKNLPALDNLTIANPDQFTELGDQTFQYNNMTNDVVFNNVTKVGAGAISYATRIKYISLPNVTTMGTLVGFCSSFPDDDEHGLRVLRIGDTLANLPNQSNCKPFYSQYKLHTIEFVTDETDWISAWNNHAILPNLFGTATGDSSLSEAALVPMSAPSSYYGTGTSYPKPTKIKVIRRN